MNLTVNQAMALEKAVKSRLSQLRSLRSEVATKTETKWYTSNDRDKQETITPQFDVKAVDKKVTELEYVLFKMDGEIKQSNAKTEINVEVDVETLLAPLV